MHETSESAINLLDCIIDLLFLFFVALVSRPIRRSSRKLVFIFYTFVCDGSKVEGYISRSKLKGNATKVPDQADRFELGASQLPSGQLYMTRKPHSRRDISTKRQCPLQLSISFLF